MEPVWWHWLVFGLLLVVAELAIPSFFIIWFGVAAILVGLSLLGVTLSFTAQLFSFTALSLALLTGKRSGEERRA